MNVVLVLVLLVPLLAAGLVACLSLVPQGRLLADLLTVTATAACLIGAVAAAAGWWGNVRPGHRVVLWMGGWTPHHGESVGIALVADQRSLEVIALAAILVLAALAFSWHFLEDTDAAYQVLILVFLGSLSGFCLAGDLFNAFVWFELMGVAAYALTGLRVEEPRSLHGALTFGVVNTVGASFTLVGVAVLYGRTGELNMSAAGRVLAQGPDGTAVRAAMVLLFAGVLVKLAIVPFHFWTADAEAVAPTPVCVLLSGAMIAAAAFALSRWWTLVFARTVAHVPVEHALLGFGTATAVLGAVMCLGQRHIKRMLAFSTVSHAGVLLCCVALMSPDAWSAGDFYALGHACSAGALFLVTGSLLNRYGSVDELELQGCGERHLLGVCFVLGALGLGGLPPFGTWTGKAALDEAATKSGHEWLVGVAAFSAVLTCAAALRVAGRVWWGLGPVNREDRGSTGSHGEEPETESGDAGVVRYRLGVAVPPWVLLGLGAAAVIWSSWSVSSVVVSVVGVLVAGGVAAAMLWSSPPRWLSRPMELLHEVHRAHIGDYVSWVLLGVAVLGAVVLA